MQVVKYWHRLPREVWESSSLEVFKIKFNIDLSNLIWADLCECSVGLDDFWRALPTLIWSFSKSHLISVDTNCWLEMVFWSLYWVQSCLTSSLTMWTMGQSAPQEIHGCNKTGASGWLTRGPHSHWEGPWQAQVGWQKSYKVQQGGVQRPAPGEEQLQVPVHAEGHPAGRKLCRKGPGSSGGHRAEHEPAVCPRH